ncbi:MAG: SRPBCC family protein [Burkholderiales bacterium]
MEQAGTVRDKPALSLDRHYAVAPEKVWRAWTDPQALAKWWGPTASDLVSLAELDVRVGGRLRIVFGGAQGREHECAGVYKEVVPNRKLAFTWCWPNSTPDRVSLVTIHFKPAGTGTDLTFLHEQFFDEAARDGHRRGWTVTLDKLDAFLQQA